MQWPSSFVQRAVFAVSFQRRHQELAKKAGVKAALEWHDAAHSLKENLA
jgi:hypothetical protein